MNGLELYIFCPICAYMAYYMVDLDLYSKNYFILFVCPLFEVYLTTLSVSQNI
jgi:hypothetical protein